ncbi:MAG: helix-turn-helix domain-containing protein [Planctomycetota bacterium]
MAQKFTSLEEAADKLGVSKDRLNELREAGDLRAYKDGAGWKFRTEDIDKMADEGVPGAAATDDDDDDLVLGVEPLADGDDAESILLAEDDLDVAPSRPPSTIIGKNEMSEDDDLTLASESSLAAESTDAGGSFAELEELELDLEAASSRILDAGDVSAAQKAVEQSQEPSQPSSDLALDDDDLDLDLDMGSDAAGQTGELPSLSGAEPSGGSSLALDTDGSDDDLVLGDGSDVSLASGDSGINLAPSDSGIALDDVPLDLAGSAIGSALDLAALSAVAQQKDADAGDSLAAGDSLSSGDDFLLTPGDDGDEDEEDSSQVVALSDVGVTDDDPVAFDAVDDGDDDSADLGFTEAGDDFGGGVEAAPAAAAAAVGGASEFPTWVVVMLGLSLVTMTLCGIMTLDLIGTMWSWKEPYTVNSALMDGIRGLFG